MQAGILKALLANVPDEIDVVLDMLDYDVDVGGVEYSEQYGTLFIRAVEEDASNGAGDDAEDENTIEGEWECGDSCALPEKTYKGVEEI